MAISRASIEQWSQGLTTAIRRTLSCCLTASRSWLKVVISMTWELNFCKYPKYLANVHNFWVKKFGINSVYLNLFLKFSKLDWKEILINRLVLVGQDDYIEDAHWWLIAQKCYKCAIACNVSNSIWMRMGGCIKPCALYAGEAGDWETADCGKNSERDQAMASFTGNIKSDEENYIPDKIRIAPSNKKYVQSFNSVKKICQSNQYICFWCRIAGGGT